MPRQPKPWWRAERKAWYARIRGRQVRLAEDHAEAVAIFHRLMAAEGRTPRGKLTVALLCDLFLDHAHKTTRPKTYEFYRDRLESLAGRYRGMQAEAIKPLHISAWLNDHPGWGQATRRGYITAAKRAWRWGLSEGHIAADPLASVKRPKMPRRKVMSAEDHIKIFRAAGPAFRQYIEVAGLLGARPGELLSISAERIAIDKKSISVIGKRGERSIPLTDRAREVLIPLARRRPTGPLLVNERGKPWTPNAIRCAFRRAMQRTGVEHASAYSLRHLFGTLALERGVDGIYVAEMMGHKDVKMLMEHYNQSREDHLRAMAERATEGNPKSDT